MSLYIKVYIALKSFDDCTAFMIVKILFFYSTLFFIEETCLFRPRNCWGFPIKDWWRLLTEDRNLTVSLSHPPTQSLGYIDLNIVLNIDIFLYIFCYDYNNAFRCLSDAGSLFPFQYIGFSQNVNKIYTRIEKW